MRFIKSIALICIAIVTAAAHAQQTSSTDAPLAQHIPANTVYYIGWAGADALAPAFANSHLQAITATMNLPALLFDYLPKLVHSFPPFAQHADSIANALELSAAVWHHPAAFFVAYDAPTDPNDDPIFHEELLCDAGPDAASLAKLLATTLPSPDSAKIATAGPLVIVAPIGTDPLPTDPKTKLSDSATFLDILHHLPPSPALVLYADAKPFLDQLDAAANAKPVHQDIATEWPKIRDQLGLAHLGQFGYASGFDNKDWASAWLLSTTGPHDGLLAVIEPKPADPALLSRIPANAVSASIFNFDPAKLYDLIEYVIQTTASANSQHNDFNQQIARLDAALGIDLRQQILGAMGTQWATFSGKAPGSTVVINRANDASAFLTALVTIARHAADRMGNTSIRVHEDTLDSLDYWTLAFPLGSISFANKNGMVYFAKTGRAVVDAANAPDTAPDQLITHRPEFTAALGHLAAPTVGSFDFTDLRATTPGAIQQLTTFLLLANNVSRQRGLPPLPITLPQIADVLKEVSPSLTVTWSDDHGIYSKSIAPFPLSNLAANPASALTTIGTGALTVSILLPSLDRARETANRVKCASNEHTIMKAVIAYANNHNGAYPPDLRTLVLEQKPNPNLFLCPDSNTTLPNAVQHGSIQQQADWIQSHSDYTYLGNGKHYETPTRTVILTESESNHRHDGVNLAFADGTVEFCKPDLARRLIAESNSNHP